MYTSTNKVRNIELPENLFSNLGEARSRNLANKAKTPKESETKKYIPTTIPKLTNYEKHESYRNRIDKMYENLKDISPIDDKIDKVLYFNNYSEKGIVIKPKVSSLRQFWTEYRLMDNEKATIKQSKETSEKNIEEFDKLFTALQSRVTEINKYIDELKEMRTAIDKSNTKLEIDKEELSKEKQKFLDFKKKEEQKLDKEKEKIKINYDRLQSIIDDLDKKLGSIDE